MRKLALLSTLLLGIPGAALARDTIVRVPLAEVVSMPEASGHLDGTVKFFLAGQKTPKVLKKLNEAVSNQKTNGLGKSDEFACKWAILSALLLFQKSAKAQGANAVIDLVGYYKRAETRSDTTIECHAGVFVVGAALKGSYAKIAQ